MAEETMPATEAGSKTNDEISHYEFAFHVLPTVAEGEVGGVFEALKSLITKAGAELTDEEAPRRFQLAYEIKEMIDGRYQKFTESFLGWMRFTLEPSALEKITESIAAEKNVLRHIIVRLDKAEEENPFRVFEKKEEPVIVSSKSDDESGEGEVSPEELEKSLEEITS